MKLLWLLFVFLIYRVNCASTSSFPKLCGQKKAVGGLIVNGTAAHRNEWPWLVVLCYGTTTEKCFCGGSVITSKHVVTAAHCLHPKDDQDVGKTYWPEAFVYAGKHDLTDDSEQYQSRAIKNYEVHPKWETRAESYDSDVAVLYLDKPLRFNQKIQPICLPSAGEYNSGSGIVVSLHDALVILIKNSSFIIRPVGESLTKRKKFLMFFATQK